MKRILAFMLVIVSLVSFSACNFDKENRDIYEYDTFLNSKWGDDPEEVFADLGLNKKQIVRQSQTTNSENGYPEGTFSYKITKFSSMFGTPVKVELLFADNLYEIPTHIGLYAVKVNFIEDYPDNFPANSVQWEPSDYKLDIEVASEELGKRILYNTVYEEYKDGKFGVQSYSCSNTPNTIGGELKELLKSVPSVGGISVNDEPLSKIELYYGNPDKPSYLIYSGLSAAGLANME